MDQNKHGLYIDKFLRDKLLANLDRTITESIEEIITPASTIAHVTNADVGITPEQLDATSHSCKKAVITTSELNTGWIRVGGSGLTTTSGVLLYPGESWEIEISDTNLIYVVAEIAASSVSVTYFN